MSQPKDNGNQERTSYIWSSGHDPTVRLRYFTNQAMHSHIDSATQV